MLDWLKHRFKASEWEKMKRAAEAGDAKAQFYLGVVFHYGQDQPPDLPRALSWYEKAATQGNATAQAALGLLYGNGGRGIRSDVVRAYAWASLAAATLPIAAKMVREVSKGMTQSQIQRAKELAPTLVARTQGQASTPATRDALRAHYLRLVEEHGLKLDALERPASWLQELREVVHSVERTDSPDSARATFRHYYPDLLRASTKMFESGPGFSPVIDHIAAELEAAIPRLGRKLPMAVLVREFPTDSFNAHCRLADGGALILLNSGLFHFLNKVVKLMVPLNKAVQYSALNQYDGSKTDGAFAVAVGHEWVSADEAAGLLSQILFGYFTGNFSFTHKFPSVGGPDGILKGSVVHACESFVLAHEYGHVLAGHINSSNTTFVRTSVGRVECARKSREQEFEADRLGVLLQHAAQVRVEGGVPAEVVLDMSFTMAAVTAVMALDALVEDVGVALGKNAALPEPERTHPRGSERMAALRSLFGSLGVKGDEPFMDMANGFENWINQVGRTIRLQVEADPESWLFDRMNTTFELVGITKPCSRKGRSAST
jgi:hypothetical protein